MDHKKSKSKSVYSKEDRQNIVRQIERLTDPSNYTKIFYILMEDESNTYTSNSNGVFLNLSLVSDETLDKVKRYLAKLDRINKKKSKIIELDENSLPDGIGCKTDDRIYRLSNYEKNIIKQKNLSKTSNDDDVEYEEIRFQKIPSKSKSKKSTKSVKIVRSEQS